MYIKILKRHKLFSLLDYKNRQMTKERWAPVFLQHLVLICFECKPIIITADKTINNKHVMYDLSAILFLRKKEEKRMCNSLKLSH